MLLEDQQLKILFVGDLNEYGRSFQRYKTFKEMGHEVFGLSFVPVSSSAGSSKKESFLYRLMWKLGWPLDTTNVNKNIIKTVKENDFDVAWIEKGNIIRPNTLKFIKNHDSQPKLVSCSEDDMYAKHNRAHYYTRSLPLYDVVFTTKVYNLEELKTLGARRTELFLDSYDEKLHRPIELTEEDKKTFASEACFVGTFEKERAMGMLHLAENEIAVTVWGNGWTDWQGKNPNLIIKNRPAYNEEYVKAVCGAKINLCFLRKINRDEVTSRSVEIPACGGFMLAERTKRHQEFFEEDKEATFFSSDGEMLEKARYYLKNDEERKKIAEAGYQRCLESGYSTREQLKQMLTKAMN